MRSVLFLCPLLLLCLEGCSREQGTHPTGKALYLRYCASCHGEEGKGNGPVASTLRQAPADLTILARRAGGRFDDAHVIAVIDGRHAVATHGPREMPVWGVIFEEELKDRPYPGYISLLRPRVLADYLRTMQQQ